MKTLILMRHAKSSWDNLSLADHERPLNKRGEKSAKTLGEWLRGKQLIPDEALVSSAQRTQETFHGLRLETEPTIINALYNSSANLLQQTLSKAGGDTVLLIAHNPGIAYFAELLTAHLETPVTHPKFFAYPTGATLVMQWDTTQWSTIDLSKGTLLDFVVPRELA